MVLSGLTLDNARAKAMAWRSCPFGGGISHRGASLQDIGRQHQAWCVGGSGGGEHVGSQTRFPSLNWIG